MTSRWLVLETSAAFGRVDSLINNAGLMQLGTVLTSDVEGWR